MRKTITGTGGMLLLQTLKDAGVEYLFTNPGSAETGIFAALAEDGDQRLVVGKHEGLVAAMADGYHRVSGKVGVVIAHVMGGSYQLAGPALQRPGRRLVAAGDRGRLGLGAAGLPRPRAVPRPEPGRIDAARSPRRRAAPTRCTRTRRPSPWPPSARCARPPRRRPGPCTSRSAPSCCTPKGSRRRSARARSTRSSGRGRRGRRRWRRSPSGWARRSARC